MGNTIKLWFDHISKDYDKANSLITVKNEINQIEKELSLKAGDSILDIGCGTGNHAIELAQKGYNVTALDVSPEMIKIAHDKAIKAKVRIDFKEIEAENFTSNRMFDAAISMHQGALCLLNEYDSVWGKDMSVLGNMSDLLKPNGKYYITVLNAIKFYKELNQNEIDQQKTDIWSASQKKYIDIIDNNNQKQQLTIVERYYTPAELTRMLNRVKLKIDNIKTSIKDKEIIVIGHKKE